MRIGAWTNYHCCSVTSYIFLILVVLLSITKVLFLFGLIRGFNKRKDFYVILIVLVLWLLTMTETVISRNGRCYFTEWKAGCLFHLEITAFHGHLCNNHILINAFIFNVVILYDTCLMLYMIPIYWFPFNTLQQYNMSITMWISLK